MRSRHPQLFFVWGEIDIANVRVLRADLFHTIDRCAGDVLVDCAALTFVDSSGVRVLIDAQTYLRQNGRELRITNLLPGPRRVFEALGLLDQLPIGPYTAMS